MRHETVMEYRITCQSDAIYALLIRAIGKQFTIILLCIYKFNRKILTEFSDAHESNRIHVTNYSNKLSNKSTNSSSYSSVSIDVYRFKHYRAILCVKKNIIQKRMNIQAFLLISTKLSCIIYRELLVIHQLKFNTLVFMLMRLLTSIHFNSFQ